MTESRRYQDTYRRMLLDMHVPDWDPAFLSEYRPEDVARKMVAAGADGVMVYAKSHVGLCYWPTVLGRRHQTVASEDVFGQAVDALRASGAGVCAYYSVVFDNWAAETQPGWRQVNRAGVDPWPFMRYGVCCLNNPDYRAYERDLFDEFLTMTDGYDAVFVDMIFWPMICGCEHCRRRFADESGSEMPERVDWSSPGWTSFQSARERWADEMAAEFAALTHAARPGTAFTHNFAPSWMGMWEYGQSISSARHDDFVAGDLYGDHVEQLVVSKAMLHLAGGGGTPEFMTSASPDLHDHVRRKPTATLRAQALAAASVSAAFLVIDAIDPRGGLDDDLYRRLPEVFAATEPYLGHLGGRPLEDVVVLLAVDSQVDFAHNGRPATDFMAPATRPAHLRAVRGACAALQEAHVPFGVVTRTGLAGLHPSQVLVVPNAERLDAEELAVVGNHLRAGGHVYASRNSLLIDADRGPGPDFLLGDDLGFHLGGREPGPAFVRLDDALAAATDGRLVSFPRQSQGLGGVPLVAVDPGRADVEVLARLTLPYGHPSPGTAADKRWASIHASPPWEDRDDPVIVESAPHSGRLVYSSVDLESIEGEDSRRLFLALVERLRRERTFEVETHPWVWSSAWEQGNAGRTVLSLLNYPTQLPPVPVPAAFTLRAPAGRHWRRLFAVPESAGLESRVVDEGVVAGRVESVAELVLIVGEWA